LPFKKIKLREPVVVLGDGKYSLEGYSQTNPVIAGIGLMTHPAEWPDLLKQYPIAFYLQHSEWTRNIYAAHFGAGKCAIWPAGIDTDKWSPATSTEKKWDVLVYNKIMWDKQHTNEDLRLPIIKKLEEKGLSYQEIAYGQYEEKEFHKLLRESRAMVFLCEHESQGFALCEALSMDIPVLAWDQGYWLDPNRFQWGEKEPLPATSVPYFDGRCGARFKNLAEFDEALESFWQKVKNEVFSPRAYILENLTLKKSVERMLEIIGRVYK
jgi:glycosyltransferase involved in cell wall biosynthesis